MLLAIVTAVVLIGLPAARADARADPVAHVDPFAATPQSCIVPALFRSGAPCSPLRAPQRGWITACNLPVLYLGGTPGPCPESQDSPESRIIPLAPAEISR